jgi:hypothetical protein
MAKINRRSAMSTAAAGAAALGTGSLTQSAAGAEPTEPKLWTLEGVLKVHPKFVYRYYLVLLDGQKCALYGPDHAREMEQLARLPVPSTIRVRGVLGTDHHAGGTKDNLSPFPAGWWVYMDVHEVTALK